MYQGRWFDRLVAMLMVAVALLCLRGAYGAAALALDESAAMLRLPIFIAGAAVLGFGAWRRWSGAHRPAPATPAFGRDARPRNGGRPRRTLVIDTVLVLAIVMVLYDHFVPLRTMTAAPKEDEPLVEALPDATEPPQEESAEAPAAEDAAAPEIAERQSEVDAAGAPEAAPVPATPPDTTEPEAAPPPRTVAPPPPPVQQPTQADGHRDGVVWLSVSPERPLLLSAGIDHAIKLWDLGEARLRRNLGAHKDMARAALFMPDGLHALTAGDDGEIVLRALEDGTVVHVFAAPALGAASTIAISPDGRIAVSGHRGGGVVIWDIENRQARHVMSGHAWSVVSVAVSPDGRRAVSGSIDGVLKLWDVESGQQVRDWLGHDRGVYGSAFMADGRRFVTGSGDFTIKLWDIDTGVEIRRFTGHSGTVYALGLSADESRILSGSLDGTARIWDVETGREIAQFAGNGGPVYAVTFAADGSVLTGARNGAIRSWRPDSGEAAVLFPAAGN